MKYSLIYPNFLGKIVLQKDNPFNKTVPFEQKGTKIRDIIPFNITGYTQSPTDTLYVGDNLSITGGGFLDGDTKRNTENKEIKISNIVSKDFTTDTKAVTDVSSIIL